MGVTVAVEVLGVGVGLREGASCTDGVPGRDGVRARTLGVRVRARNGDACAGGVRGGWEGVRLGV